MSTIKTRVMSAVFMIRAFRMAKSPTALKAYALILSVWGISRLVWVSKVFENFSMAQKAGIDTAANYLLYAVEHTHLGVQVMLLVAIVVGFSLFSDALRAAPVTRGARFAA
jgi:hypothetical protein